MKPPIAKLTTCLIFCCTLTAMGQVPLAGTSPVIPPAHDDPDDSTPLILAEVAVIGSKQNVERLPGSGSFIDAGEIRAFAYDDINQVIRRTPGVYIRQEDGYGLFPNVSLRGVSTTRNGKITVMEDGILMAPAPYSDPSAYYTPNAGRMSGLEVLKGSSQIKYGPESTGGVINYISTPIPKQDSGYLSASYGSDNDLRVQAYYGGRAGTSWGTFGYLVENVYREAAGFKTIDATPGGGYLGSARTGFNRNEPMVKLRFDFKAAIPQTLEFKYGRTDIDADETYLGLTDADFRVAPFRRYAASRYDNITTKQERFSVRYLIQPSADLKLSLTAYQNDFARNWYKLDGASVGSSGFLNLSEALANQYGQSIIDVLKGSAAGRLRVRANNRTYGTKGIDSLVTWEFIHGKFTHRLETGLRYHRDFADRFQWDDIYTQSANGNTSQTTAGIPGTQDNRRAESEALAYFIQDRITVGRLTVIPGFRLESIDYTDIRRSTTVATLNQVTSVTGKTIDYIAPGAGATWQQSDSLTFLAGVHRGISPPGPTSAGTNLQEEASLGIEVGLRYNNRRDFSAELIAFHTAFTNLIVEQNAGGGGDAGQTSNIGEVNSTGVELALAYDPSINRGWAARNPWNLSFTWTHARLGNDVNATGNSGGVAESIFSGGRKGNQLPYIPNWQLALGTGLESGKWGVYLDSYYQPGTWASANNADARVNPDASEEAGLQPALDSRYGRVDAFLLVDVAVHYRLTTGTRLKLACTNLLDWAYMSSRVPIGPRPGTPRMVSAGVEVKF